MLKTELLEQNLRLTEQNIKLAHIVKTMMQWVVSINDHYISTQKGLTTLSKGIGEARKDFSSFLEGIKEQLENVPTQEEFDTRKKKQKE